LELVNTFATLGTFVVIAATATAAIVQLRHMRGSNQITVLNELRETRETPEFQMALQFAGELPVKIRDPAFRYQLANRFARTDENSPLFAKISRLGNYYEGMGILVKTGLVEKDLVLDFWCGNAVGDWERLAPATAILRRREGQGLWENFEYLAVLAKDWDAAHPSTYPAGVRRMELEDEWLEADKQYAASFATA
jgi:hypothetical protein